MKKMSQKKWLFIIGLLLILFNSHLSAQEFIVIDDVSTIHDTERRDPVRLINNSSLTFKNERYVGHSNVKIEIRETGTRRIIKEVTANIVNGFYQIPNVDISMLALDKTYDINTYYSTQLPAAHGIGRTIQIKRISKR